ncbi:MAG: hypothetical protein ACI9CU_002196 [Polaribacter sp.]|jgi:hypothetical protein
MKIFKLTHVLGAALIGLASFSSCSDACKDVDCGTGTCLEGVCTCPDGFSGTNCAVDECAALACDADGGNTVAVAAGCDCNCNDGYTGDDCASPWSDGFVGTYNGDDDCGFLYQSVVSSTTDNVIVFTNFMGLLATGTANVVSANTIQIPSQTVNGETIAGLGELIGTVLIIEYTFNGDDCTVTYTKQ